MDIYDERKVWLFGFDKLKSYLAVNLSSISILTGKSASYCSSTLGSNRTKLPSMSFMAEISEKVFSMSFDDVLAVGFKEAGIGSNGKTAPVVEPWTGDLISSFDGEQLAGIVGEYTSSVSRAFADYAEMISNRINLVTKDRNRLLKENKLQNTILNVIRTGIRLVDRDYKVIYANSPISERTGITVGDSCRERCNGDDSDCIAGVVFTSAEPCFKTKVSQGMMFLLSAYPVFDDEGQVKYVLIASMPTDAAFKFLKDLGWNIEPPK